MNIEVKNSLKLVDYTDSMKVLEKRVDDVLLGKKDELVPVEHINELNKRLSDQKGIKVEFESIADANHFFSKADSSLTKSLNKYIKKETALY